MIERTLCLIKPDVASNQIWVNEILMTLMANGLTIVNLQTEHWNKAEAGLFYHEHKGKSFYDNLINFMSSGPLIAIELSGENAITKYRALMGCTDPQKAAIGTLRRKYGTGGPLNAVHGSDSKESAENEIDIIFGRME